MAGMGAKAQRQISEQILKPLILKAMQDGFKATFAGNNTELGDAIALKFAQTVADGITGPICDAIENIVTQAQITGVLATPVPVTGALGPGTGTPVTVLPTDLSVM